MIEVLRPSLGVTPGRLKVPIKQRTDPDLVHAGGIASALIVVHNNRPIDTRYTKSSPDRSRASLGKCFLLDVNQIRRTGLNIDRFGNSAGEFPYLSTNCLRHIF